MRHPTLHGFSGCCLCLSSRSILFLRYALLCARPGGHMHNPEPTLSFTFQFVLYRSCPRGQSAPRRRGHRGPRTGRRRQVALRWDRRSHQSPGCQALCEGSDHILSGSQGGSGRWRWGPLLWSLGTALGGQPLELGTALLGASGSTCVTGVTPDAVRYPSLSHASRLAWWMLAVCGTAQARNSTGLSGQASGRPQA